MIVMVTGGRTYRNKAVVARALEGYVVGDYLLVGGADGADELARQYWHYELQLPYIVHPAPWNRSGRAAGIQRNMAMLKGLTLAPYARLVPDELVAFPGNRGTQNARDVAFDQGIPVVSM